jgi:superfamily II DNA/RNA helicase
MSPSFAELGVPAELVDQLARAGIQTPFPIQTSTIPDLLAGRDVCGRAPTGSGKTLAFGLPLVADLRRAQPRRPDAVVLAPTRELAEQIRVTLAPLVAVRDRHSAAVYGGVSYENQRKRLRRGVDLLVACPGRLADLVSRGDADLGGVRRVVIDEADRMADMGFLPQVRRLLDLMPRSRQTVMFSATLDGDVAVLTDRYQHDPVVHRIADEQPDVRAAHHVFWAAENHERVALTASVVTARGATVVFCRTRHRTDRIATQLERAGIRAVALHGGRSQGQRDRALRAFSQGNADVLVATDVAARGVHVDDVACVVHFDMPEDDKAYVHRSGRTARAGSTGTVVSLVGRDQLKAVRALQRDLGIEPGVTVPSLSDLDRDPIAKPIAKPIARDRTNHELTRHDQADTSSARSAGGDRARRSRTRARLDGRRRSRR